MKLLSVAFVGLMIALALPLAVAPRAMAANVSYQWAGNSAQQVEWNADAANWESRAEGVKDWTPNSMPPSAGDPYNLTFSKQANQTVKVRVSTPMPVIMLPHLVYFLRMDGCSSSQEARNASASARMVSLNTSWRASGKSRTVTDRIPALRN